MTDDNFEVEVGDTDEFFEEHVYFVGPCTCEHERAQHGWGSCDVEDCACEAGWEE